MKVMKLWKKLLGAVLLLSVVLCVTSIIAAADDTHSHPVCGATHTDIGDHTAECAPVTWTEWDGTSEIDYGDSNIAYVYLTANATRSSTLKVTGGTLNLCLNGKTLNAKIEVNGGATLNICDCQGGGEITNTSNEAVYVNNTYDCATDTTLNVYGGKISASGSYTINLRNDNWKGERAAVFNMYGGEVYNNYNNTNYGAVDIPRTSGNALYKINVYGGKITDEYGYGIKALVSNAKILIAGGTVTGANAALEVLGNLTLTGSPTLSHTNKDGKDIGITTSSSGETENKYIVVNDDFIPASGTTISVTKYIDTESVVIAKPESGKSLQNKSQYFVSAKEGYFVDVTDGNLSLAACAITEQPTAGNRYTVTANGNPRYQWYGTKKGNVTVTDDNATAGDFNYSVWGGEWNYNGNAEGYTYTPLKLKLFTLYMAAGDVLTLKKESEYGDFYVTDIAINDVFIEEGTDGYTFTVAEDGDYTVEITAMWMDIGSDYRVDFTFTAMVSDDVAGNVLSGQTDKTLDTSKLDSGKYICAVIWEGKTTLYSNAVEFTHSHTWNDGEVTTEPTCTVTGEKTFTCTECSETKTETIDALGHDYTGATWQHDDKQHWKECSRCREKKDIADHSGGAASCTDSAVCTVCEQHYGDSLGHDYTNVTWQHDDKQHWKECSRCHEKKDVADHFGGTATCTEQAECATCGELYGDALGHDYTNATWKHDDKQHWKECSRCQEKKDIADHSGGTATCTDSAVCTVCEQYYGDSLGHDYTGATWKHDDKQHWKECSRCREKKDIANHSGGTATCTEQAECETCGQLYGDVLGHDYTNATWQHDDKQHWKECSRCQEKKDIADHSGGAATCTDSAVCTACEQHYGNSLGHDYTNVTWKHNDKQHWKECSRCREKKDIADHSGGTATCKDRAVCTTCSNAYGALNPNNHVGGTEMRDMIQATAEKEGHTGNCYCKGCNAKLSDGTVIPVISNLVIDRKSDLTTAVEEMEKVLNDQSGVYTDEQKKQLVDSINEIKSSLKSIENTEEAMKKAGAMPAVDKTKPDDKVAIDAYEAAKKAYDALSDDEKRMAGESTNSALDAMLKALTAYDITYGNGSTWTKNDNNNGLTFTVNGYHKKFADLIINGEVVNKKYYEIESGSTVITLKSEYLQELPAGKYTLHVRYTDGSTDGEDTFTITKNESAKDGINIRFIVCISISITVDCAAVLIILLLYLKKRKQEEK